MSAPGTVSDYQPRRQVVRRRAQTTPGTAIDAALSELPVELRPLVREYAENMVQGQRIRSELSTVMTAHKLHWWEIDRVARRLIVA